MPRELISTMPAMARVRLKLVDRPPRGRCRVISWPGSRGSIAATGRQPPDSDNDDEISPPHRAVKPPCRALVFADFPGVVTWEGWSRAYAQMPRLQVESASRASRAANARPLAHKEVQRVSRPSRGVNNCKKHSTMDMPTISVTPLTGVEHCAAEDVGVYKHHSTNIQQCDAVLTPPAPASIPRCRGYGWG